jgi:hypothetical protein
MYNTCGRNECIYDYNYTHICNCDSLIRGKFGSSLYFVKKSVVIRGSLLTQ